MSSAEELDTGSSLSHGLSSLALHGKSSLGKASEEIQSKAAQSLEVCLQKSHNNTSVVMNRTSCSAGDSKSKGQPKISGWGKPYLTMGGMAKSYCKEAYTVE